MVGGGCAECNDGTRDSQGDEDNADARRHYAAFDLSQEAEKQLL